MVNRFNNRRDVLIPSHSKTIIVLFIRTFSIYTCACCIYNFYSYSVHNCMSYCLLYLLFSYHFIREDVVVFNYLPIYGMKVLRTDRYAKLNGLECTENPCTQYCCTIFPNNLYRTWFMFHYSNTRHYIPSEEDNDKKKTFNVSVLVVLFIYSTSLLWCNFF